MTQRKFNIKLTGGGTSGSKLRSHSPYDAKKI